MLPDPSIRKTMSISWWRHSAIREGGIRATCVDPSHLLSPRTLSAQQSGDLGISTQCPTPPQRSPSLFSPPL
jgi:hypothetical protein